MTTWDNMVARLIEGIEKLTGALASWMAWAENKSRYISLLVRRSEKRKELERAYARLGRLVEEIDEGETGGLQPNPDIQEARQAVAALQREMEELERLMGLHG